MSSIDTAQELGEKFPDRDSLGYVVGYYVYTREGERVAGPFPTRDEAVARMGSETDRRFFGKRIVCGLVFTSNGMAVRERQD